MSTGLITFSLQQVHPLIVAITSEYFATLPSHNNYDINFFISSNSWMFGIVIICSMVKSDCYLWCYWRHWISTVFAAAVRVFDISVSALQLILNGDFAKLWCFWMTTVSLWFISKQQIAKTACPCLFDVGSASKTMIQHYSIMFLTFCI